MDKHHSPRGTDGLCKLIYIICLFKGEVNTLPRLLPEIMSPDTCYTNLTTPILFVNSIANLFKMFIGCLL